MHCACIAMHWTLQTPESNKLLVGSRHRGKSQFVSLFLELSSQCYGFKRTALKRTDTSLRACAQSGVLPAPCQVRDYMQGLNPADADSSAPGKTEGLLLVASDVLVSQCLPCLQCSVVQFAALAVSGKCLHWSRIHRAAIRACKALTSVSYGRSGIGKEVLRMLDHGSVGIRNKYAGNVKCTSLGRSDTHGRLETSDHSNRECVAEFVTLLGLVIEIRPLCHLTSSRWCGRTYFIKQHSFKVCS